MDVIQTSLGQEVSRIMTAEAEAGAITSACFHAGQQLYRQTRLDGTGCAN